jgi:RHH-type proline utilization regulon transcriptional repressor/proline dehydrogenase/delta 1-pyrroline-5-carboxylate dehydrogenase
MERAREVAAGALAAVRGEKLRAGPIVGGKLVARPAAPVTNPADRKQVAGEVGSATVADIAAAAKLARKAQPRWNARLRRARQGVARDGRCA